MFTAAEAHHEMTRKHVCAHYKDTGQKAYSAKVSVLPVLTPMLAPSSSWSVAVAAVEVACLESSREPHSLAAPTVWAWSMNCCLSAFDMKGDAAACSERGL